MALQVITDWKEAIQSSLDLETGRITLRGRRGGKVLPTAGESPERVRESNYVPRLGDSHPDNLLLICTDVNCEKQLSNIIVEWSAEYLWTTPAPGSQIGGVPSSWSVTRSTLPRTESIDRDYYGAPILNAVGDAPDPPLTEEFYDAQYVFTAQGRRPFNGAFWNLYDGARNSDVWLGYPVGSCKITSIVGRGNYRQNEPPQFDLEVTVVYGKPPPLVNATAAENAKGAAYFTWFKRWRSEGYYARQFTAAGAKVVRIFDEIQQPSIKPKLISRADGTLIYNPDFAEWNLTQTHAFLPFGTFFNNA